MMLDGGFFRFLQSFTGNPVIDQFMVFSAEFLVFLVPLSLVYIWFEGEEGRHDSLYVFFTVLFGLGASYMVLGQVYSHRPPYQGFDTVASGGPENSFPSQHTTVLLSMVLPLLWKKRRKMASLMLSTGALTGFARIFIGEHYLIDIIGAGFAALTGFIAVFLLEKYFDDQVEQLADIGHGIERKISGLLKSIFS